ncbi:MAG: TatD family hydrolase, partial [Deltaproteobacteria bacterium]|nr:TatD family hydrolase [Deltaproteobacteria bacterium]
REVPAGQLLTETDNPGGLKWLRGVNGRPLEIEKVVQVVAALRQSTAEAIETTVCENFMRLIKDDPWVSKVHF